MEQNKNNELKSVVALYSEFYIKEEPFTICFGYESVGQQSVFVAKAIWKNQNHHSFSISDLTEFFSIALPSYLDLTFTIDEVSLSYLTSNQDVTCVIKANGYSQLKLGTNLIKEAVRQYFIGYTSTYIYKFSSLPIIKDMLSSDDGIGLTQFSLRYIPDQSISIQAELTLVLGRNKIVLPMSFVEQQKKMLQQNHQLLGQEASDSIHWIDINKSIRTLYFKRIGFELLESKVKLYLTAGFTISILSIDFYELFLTIPLLQSGSVDFGLSGLSVTLKKPPIALSGGLYKKPNEVLYNGEIVIRISKFALTALGSYGKMDNGDSTFFLYLLIDYPIGGTSYFFVNGLALGFGVNRRLRMPSLKEVRAFPLVSAVLGENPNLTAKTSPAQALDQLSDWIYPSAGDYFVSAGLKVLSFGFLETFVLLSVEFGNHLRISLLGTSTASIPPKIGGSISPIAYACLALEAVFDPSEGEIYILGCLTEESFLLDRKCHLTGGFGFCVWYKGQYAGDFLVTIGGCHHPKFRNVHYPELDAVGINWQIDSHLRLKGTGYFALTPSCIMAGADAEISYTAGNLKAWLTGKLSIYMQWKPFQYDFEAGVSVGASYTMKVFGISTTFRLEIGANLHVWGPNFSCSVHISWFIISFTISYIDGKKVDNSIEWKEFSDSFLPTEEQNQTYMGLRSANNSKDPSCQVQITDGSLRTYKKDTGESVTVACLERLRIEVKGAMPCTSLFYSSDQLATYEGVLGIVPMNIKNYKSSLVVHIFNDKEEEIQDKEAITYEIITNSVPSALYKSGTPEMNDGPIQDVLVGIRLGFCEKDSKEVLPEKGSYSLQTLLERERIIRPGFVWCKEPAPVSPDYSKEEPMQMIQATWKENGRRKKCIEALSGLFNIKEETHIQDMGEDPSDYFLGNPVLRAVGAKKQ